MDSYDGGVSFIVCCFKDFMEAAKSLETELAIYSLIHRIELCYVMLLFYAVSATMAI